MRSVYLDRFDSAEHLNGKARTYGAVKAAVVKAGRFSAFEASEPKNTALFTRLCHDPDLEIDTAIYGYPWAAVKEREK